MLSILQFTSQHAEDVLRDFWRKGKRAVDLGSTEPPYAVAIPEKQADRDRLASDVAGYRLRVDADELDAMRFERLAASGRAALADGRPADAAEELRTALAALGERGYDRNERRGILLASPPRLGTAGDAWRPGKLAIIFVAADREGVFELERWFRGRFEA